jgi:signal transduction histidine kinase
VVALEPLLDRSAFVVLLAAVTISAGLGGLISGLLASLLCGLGFTFFLTAPSPGIPGLLVVVELAIFGLVSLLINVLYVHLRRAQQREELTRHMAEQAVGLRDGFLAAAAHDLANPLTAILSTCQWMRKRMDASPLHDPVRCAEAVRTINGSARRLAAQIEELLEVACAEAGRPLGLRHAPVDLVALVRHVAATRVETFLRHDVRFETDLDHLTVRCDAVRVERVVDNLLVNALKYSPLGGVVSMTLSCEMRLGTQWAVLAVRDAGLGVPAADLPRIFEPFRRAGNVGPISGTGIGLASARQIVEEHGGRISVVSHEGLGSTFTVRLPLEPQVCDLRVPQASATPIVGAD